MWNKQEEFNIFNSNILGWDPVYFVCIMNDSTIQRFMMHMDEDSEGHYNLHIDCDNDKYTIDDIVYWTNVPEDYGKRT